MYNLNVYIQCLIHSVHFLMKIKDDESLILTEKPFHTITLNKINYL